MERLIHKQLTEYLQQKRSSSLSTVITIQQNPPCSGCFSILLMPSIEATSFCSPSLTCQPLSILWNMISCGSGWQAHSGFELNRSSSWNRIWQFVLSQFIWMYSLPHLGTSWSRSCKVPCSGRCCSRSTHATSAASFKNIISYITAMRTTHNYTSPVGKV